MKRSGGIRILARRELTTLFNSPATYIVCVVYLITAGWLFSIPLFQMNQSSLDAFFRPMPLLFTFLIPALTMRTFSEEFKGGTMEYLATLPIKDYEIVLGKYLGALGWLVILLMFTLVYPITLFAVGRPDAGPLICGYLGLFCLGMFFSAIGLWASALTRNQVIAFIISFFVCFTLFLTDRLAEFLPAGVGDIIRAISINPHFDALARGILDTRDLLYWLTGSAFFLAACLTTLHSRRWRG